MKGTEAYNKEFDDNVKRILDKHPDQPYLKGFYYFLLSDGKRSYSGTYTYMFAVATFLDEMFITDPKEITLDVYTEYLVKAYSGKTTSYQILIYSALKLFSKYLKAKNINEHYMQYIGRPKFSETTETKEKREKGYMTPEEIKIFLNNIKKDNRSDCWKARNLAIATVLLNSGIRCAALQKLDINDVNFNDGSITVLEKGNKSRRIQLSDETMNYIRNWIIYRSELISGKVNEQALFISSRRSRITRNGIFKLIKKYGATIEGKNITPHKTRASYGTYLYEKTHDIYLVQKCMGHSNPKTTEMYIRGKQDDFTKKASELVSDFLI